MCTARHRMFTELNGAGKGVGDGFCRPESDSAQGGMSKFNEHRYEAEYKCGLRGYKCLWRDMCPFKGMTKGVGKN